MEILDRLRLLFRKDKEPFLQLRRIMGFYPRNIHLYRLALRHKSVSNTEREELRGKGDRKKAGYRASLNNERLEYLGDAILGAVVADILYRHFGTKQEGFLTSLRSKIVCRSSLNKLAVEMGLDKFVLYTGSATTAHNSYMNGNAFEAFFGAIYLDRGYDFCRRFMEERVFGQYIDIKKLSTEEVNHKSMLIEWCQKYQYRFQFVNREMREDKIPKFHSELRIEGLVCGAGEGYSKKESDQSSAAKALKRLRREPTLKQKIADAARLRKAQARQQSLYDKARTKMKGRHTVVFDLDGTLLDSLNDLWISTNYALRSCGYVERTLEEIRLFVGNGVRKLIERAMPDGSFKSTEDEAFLHCFSIFQSHYLEHCRDHTEPYEGVVEMLEELNKRGYRLAIVSNKLQAGVTELRERWFSETVGVAIGEDDGLQRKPAADMVMKALNELGVEATDAVYVGDSDVDILTAHNAGVPCISVLWGFRDRAFLQEHGAVVMAQKPSEVVSLLEP